MRGRLALLLVLLAGGARAEECGANAGSFAEVVEGSRGRGPIVSRPSSLCADLGERRERPPVDVHLGITPPASEAQGVTREERRR